MSQEAEDRATAKENKDNNAFMLLVFICLTIAFPLSLIITIPLLIAAQQAVVNAEDV